MLVGGQIGPRWCNPDSNRRAIRLYTKPLSIMQIDHTNYPKRLKGLDSEALRFIIKDCREAINALPDNPKNGYYADEINYCVMELHRRKNK